MTLSAKLFELLSYMVIPDSELNFWRSGISKIFNSVVTFFLLPEGQVLLEQLDDGLGVSEGLLIDVIDLLESL